MICLYSAFFLILLQGFIFVYPLICCWLLQLANQCMYHLQNELNGMKDNEIWNTRYSIAWPVWLSWLGISPQTEWFDSRSGRMPGLQVQSPVTKSTEGSQPIDVFLPHRCFSPSLSPSLPLSLK